MRKAVWLLLLLRHCHALLGVAPKTSILSLPGVELVSPLTEGIVEPAGLDTAARIRRVPVPVSASVHPSETVGITCAYWPAAASSKSLPPVILVHGFDSSCLEYRRLGSRLAANGVETYAVDLLGWGFTDLQGVTSFSAEAKVEALNSFINTVLGDNKFCIAGASLGGAAAIEVAAENPNCQGLILIDAQGFVDGIGPMAAMPKPIAQLGVQVLKSVPLRSSANQMSYYDKETYATDEAVLVGRLHCLREGWSDALVSFMQSGGFRPATKVPLIQVPSLVLWGRQDGILDGKEFAYKFVEALPDAELQWIEECGHVPHLEQPEQTASAVADFLSKRVENGVTSSTDRPSLLSRNQLVGLAGMAALGAALAADFLPVH